MNQIESRPTTPETPPSTKAYAATAKIHPRKVSGTFRSLKWWAMAAFMAVWHLAPFLRWDRGPGAPDQAILLDMTGRRAYFFFIEIWPQELYYLTGLLFIAAVTLFAMTALAGRVWCGFFCWQTVYTDLFVAIERWVIGDRAARLAFDRQPMGATKLAKRAIVNLLWAVVAAACGIGFTLYFGDAREQLRDIFTGTAGLATWGTITVVGGFCFLLAGYAREQVCIYMCPYARFQSAMFDEHSLIVSYEAWRGEKRAPAPADHDFQGRGHCVDCRACVQACPTGIDIRDGTQLACIGCALCIDACNQVMDRFDLPRGLVSYDSWANMRARAEGLPARLRLIRPRTLIYAAVLLVAAGVILVGLTSRPDTTVSVLHERAPLYVQMADGGIRNGYVYKVLNMAREDRAFTLTLSGPPGATVDVIGGESAATEARLEVPADSVGTFHIFVTAPEGVVGDKRVPLTFRLTGGHSTVSTETMFAGPGR